MRSGDHMNGIKALRDNARIGGILATEAREKRKPLPYLPRRCQYKPKLCGRQANRSGYCSYHMKEGQAQEKANEQNSTKET